MEDLERLVADRLRALDEAAPSDEARERVLGGVKRQVMVRRRKRRALRSVAGASLVAAAVVTAPVVLNDATGGERGTVKEVPLARKSPESSSTLGRDSAPGVPPKSEDAKPGGPRAGTAGGGTLPGGLTLTAFAVASDGAVLGEGRSEGSGDGTLWRADLNDLLAAPVPVAKLPAPSAASGGDGITVWPEEQDGGVELMCNDGDGGTVQLSTAGLADDGGFHADGAYAVWTDTTGTVWTARGCRDTPRKLSDGHAAGFAYPYAYVLGVADGAPTGEIRQLQIETGSARTHEVPDGLLAAGALYAAGEDTFSIAHGSALTVYDTATWAGRTLRKKLPAGGDRTGFLTAGDDLVVYSTRAEPSRSLIYDVADAKARSLSGEAFTKGSWLLTRPAGEAGYSLKPSG